MLLVWVVCWNCVCLTLSFCRIIEFLHELRTYFVEIVFVLPCRYAALLLSYLVDFEFLISYLLNLNCCYLISWIYVMIVCFDLTLSVCYLLLRQSSPIFRRWRTSWWSFIFTITMSLVRGILTWRCGRLHIEVLLGDEKVDVTKMEIFGLTLWFSSLT